MVITLQVIKALLTQRQLHFSSRHISSICSNDRKLLLHTHESQRRLSEWRFTDLKILITELINKIMGIDLMKMLNLLLAELLKDQIEDRYKWLINLKLLKRANSIWLKDHKLLINFDMSLSKKLNEKRDFLKFLEEKQEHKQNWILKSSSLLSRTKIKKQLNKTWPLLLIVD